MELRKYQEEARESIQQEWAEGRKKTLLVLPTGCGKTIVFAKVIEDRVRMGERVLVLAHRSELLDQASDKLFKSTGLQTSLEKASSTSIGSWNRVVVGSVQTLQQPKRLAKFEKDHFDSIVVDEAHHCISDGYQRVLSHFDSANVLGVTATPDRGDMRNLGTYFDSLAYEYTLPQAIKEGYLSPIKALTIPLNLDLSSVSMSQGDFKASDVGNALDPYLEQIANEMMEHCKDKKTVVFLPLVNTSKKFRDILNSKGFKAAEVNGESKDRVVVLRPTKVRSLYSQMVGRGTRLHPGKTHLLLLDFLWHTEKHELCRPAHLIAENEEVAKAMVERTEENTGAEFELLELEEVAKEDVTAQREEALAKQLAEMRKRKRKLVDPLQFEMSIHAEDLTSYVPSFGWEMSPPSDKQLQTLERLGILPDEVGNAGKAQMILDRLSKRQSEGLTTPKQIRLLERYGFRNVGMWQFEAASKLINRIAANGWRVPHTIDVHSYQGE